MAGHGDGPRTKNGPALAGHGAEAVRDAITRTITTLPEQLRRSLTWDQGAEMAQHAQLRIEAGVAVYFCDPHSPWQRGTNENTNGLLRQYFPKGTDLSAHSADDLAAVAAPSTAGRARPWAGEHPPRRWTSSSEQLTQACCDDHLNPPCTPLSLWCTRPPPWTGRRSCRACSRASSTKPACAVRDTRQPTMRRAKASITKAT